MIMLKMFRKKQMVEKQHPKMEKAAFLFAKTIISAQTHIANWLSKQEQKLSIRQKKLAFFTFCVCMSLIAGSLFFRGIFNNSNNIPGWLRQHSITIPETQPMPDSIDVDLLKKFNSNHNAGENKTDSINR